LFICHENNALIIEAPSGFLLKSSTIIVIPFYTTLVFLLILLGHQQDVLPILAALSTAAAWFLLFLRKSSFSRSLFRPIPVVLGGACLLYLISNMFLNSSDVFLSDPVGFITKDGRLLYVLGFTLVFCLPAACEFDARCLLKACFIAGLLTSALSLFLLLLNIDIYILDRRLGFADSGIPVGLLGEKNPFAGSLGSALIAGTLILIHEKRRARIFPELLGLAVILITMAWTGSRGYFLAAVAVSGFLCYFEKRGEKRNWGLLALGIITFLVGVSFFITKSWDRIYLVFHGADKNITERFLLWKYYLSLWKESILTGLGPGSGSMPDLQIQSLIPTLLGRRLSGTRFDGVFWEGGLPLGLHSHNIIVQCLLEFGLLGLLLLGAFIFYAMKACVRSLPPQVGCLAVYLFLYLFISGMADGLTLASPSISLPFFLLLALGISKASAPSFRGR